MHDQVSFLDERVDHRGVGDVALDEADPVTDRREAGLVARVGQRIENGHLGVRTVLEGVVHKVRADESGAASDQNAHQRRPLRYSGRSGQYPRAAAPDRAHRLLRWLRLTSDVVANEVWDVPEPPTRRPYGPRRWQLWLRLGFAALSFVILIGSGLAWASFQN